jgi:hypothetical protein
MNITPKAKLDANRRYRQRSKTALAAYWRAWRKKHPGRKSAHGKVQRAVKNGVLVRPKACQECGKRTSLLDAHHDQGYAMPLRVRWLCKKCHMACRKAG